MNSQISTVSNLKFLRCRPKWVEMNLSPVLFNKNTPLEPAMKANLDNKILKLVKMFLISIKLLKILRKLPQAPMLAQ